VFGRFGGVRQLTRLVLLAGTTKRNDNNTGKSDPIFAVKKSHWALGDYWLSPTGRKTKAHHGDETIATLKLKGAPIALL
jgi:hypothetical protein